MNLTVPSQAARLRPVITVPGREPGRSRTIITR